jgi:hypothetical protein
MKSCQVARLLAYISGLVNQELLLQVEYLAAENRILRAHLSGRLRLSNAERSTLAEIGKRLGRKSLSKVAQVAKPETILDWWRKLVAKKFDGSKHRSYPGRPRISPEVESLVVRFARENSGWGYDRIDGAFSQRRPCRIGPDGRKHLAAARDFSGSEAEPDNDVEAIHCVCPSRNSDVTEIMGVAPDPQTGCLGVPVGDDPVGGSLICRENPRRSAAGERGAPASDRRPSPVCEKAPAVAHT